MSSIIRIAYISDATIPSRLANSVHVMKMCRAFADLGLEVTLCALKGYGDYRSPFTLYGVRKNFKIKYMPKLLYKGPFFRSVYFVFSIFRSSIDLIYTRSLYTMAISSLFGKPVVIEMHAKFINWKITKKLLFKFSLSTGNVKGVVVISEPLRDYFSNMLNINDNQIIIAHDASDLIGESVTPVSIKNRNRISVGYVGQLFSGRGVELIFDLSKRIPDADFHIVGGFEKDINYWKIQTANQKNIIFHGFVDAVKTSSYLKAFDIVLAPYQSRVTILGEGNSSEWMSPMKLFEYMAAGTAIIASDLPAIRSILEENKTALLCKPDSLDSWYNAILFLQLNPEFRLGLGKNAQEKHSKNYTWDQRAERIFSWLK